MPPYEALKIKKFPRGTYPQAPLDIGVSTKHHLTALHASPPPLSPPSPALLLQYTLLVFPLTLKMNTAEV